MGEDALLQQIITRKAELDRLRAQAPHGLDNLNRYHDIELTYTSNAIEGNTLTAAETRMVVEHGITIGGKPLKDHLEAVGHFEALHYVRDLARQAEPLREADIRNLHRLLMQRADPDAAGRYADQGRYVETDQGGIISRRRPKSRREWATLFNGSARLPPHLRPHSRRTAALSKSIRSMTAMAARCVLS
jgi:Fic family protein